MKRLKTFNYFEPSTLWEAMEILAEQGDEALPLAGGTDLLVRMKRGDVHPASLVNLKRIKGLNQIIGEPGNGVTIGALASLAAVENSPRICSGFPVLTQAIRVLGIPSIRNLGTLGGNIGRASPAADSVPALIVLNAVVTVQGAQVKKEIKIEDFFLGPGKTILSTGEIITAVRLPEQPSRSGAVYLKLGRRAGAECALVGVAALIELSGRDNELKSARIALSAVSPAPLRAKKVEEILLSGPLTEVRAKEAARVALEVSCPLTDMRASGNYRREMSEVLAFRAIRSAYQIAKGGEVQN